MLCFGLLFPLHIMSNSLLLPVGGIYYDDRNNKSGRKVIKERHRGTEEEVTRDLYHGMEPEQREEFESDWRSVGGVHGGMRLPNGGGGVSNAPRLGNEFGGASSSASSSARSSRASSQSGRSSGRNSRRPSRQDSRQEHFRNVEHFD